MYMVLKRIRSLPKKNLGQTVKLLICPKARFQNQNQKSKLVGTENAFEPDPSPPKRTEETNKSKKAPNLAQLKVNDKLRDIK